MASTRKQRLSYIKRVRSKPPGECENNTLDGVTSPEDQMKKQEIQTFSLENFLQKNPKLLSYQGLLVSDKYKKSSEND